MLKIRWCRKKLQIKSIFITHQNFYIHTVFVSLTGINPRPYTNLISAFLLRSLYVHKIKAKPTFFYSFHEANVQSIKGKR